MKINNSNNNSLNMHNLTDTNYLIKNNTFVHRFFSTKNRFVGSAVSYSEYLKNYLK